MPAAFCVAVAAASKLEEILDINKEVVVQDFSSQQLGTMMHLISWKKEQPIKIWDCCAASGGKALLAKDIFGNVQLQLSDIRESILINLKKRLQLAGINPFRIFRADLSQPIRGIPAAPVDLVLADTPCSGSGTWGRTPEQCHFFKAAQIKDYRNLQRQIVKTLFPILQKMATCYTAPALCLRKKMKNRLNGCRKNAIWYCSTSNCLKDISNRQIRYLLLCLPGADFLLFHYPQGYFISAIHILNIVDSFADGHRF